MPPASKFGLPRFRFHGLVNLMRTWWPRWMFWHFIKERQLLKLPVCSSVQQEPKGANFSILQQFSQKETQKDFNRITCLANESISLRLNSVCTTAQSDLNLWCQHEAFLNPDCLRGMFMFCQLSTILSGFSTILSDFKYMFPVV